jgi:hypothetical protein
MYFTDTRGQPRTESTAHRAERKAGLHIIVSWRRVGVDMRLRSADGAVNCAPEADASIDSLESSSVCRGTVHTAVCNLRSGEVAVAPTPGPGIIRVALYVDF